MHMRDGIDYLDDDLWWLGDIDDDAELGILGVVGDIAKGAVNLATAPITIPAKLVGSAVGGKAGKAISKYGALAASPATMLAAKAVKKAPKMMKVTASAPKSMTQAQKDAALRAAIAASPEAKAQIAAAMQRKAADSGGGAGQLALIKAAKPRIQAKSSRTPKTPNGADAPMVAAIARKVRAELAPQLSQINKYLALANNQRTATAEHLSIKNTSAYRRKVLGDLARLAATLPAGHPTRQRIVKVGLLSGLM